MPLTPELAIGVKERREREKSHTRQRILDAARELFARQGYEAVSMRKIADAIEYSPTAIYVHFEDKESLMHELCAHDFGKLAEAMRDLAPIADPIERIRAMGKAFVKFSLEHPNHFRLMFMTPNQAKASIPADHLARRGDPAQDSYALLLVSVAQAMSQGRFRSEYEDPELVAQTFAQGIHGVVAMHIAMGNDPWIDWRDIELRTSTMIDVLIRGLTDAAAPQIPAGSNGR